MLRLCVLPLLALLMLAPIGANAAPNSDAAGAYSSTAKTKKYYKKKKRYKKRSYKSRKRKYSKQKHRYTKKKRYSRKYKKNRYAKKGRKSKDVLSGGPRPYIQPKRPAVVGFGHTYRKGSIVIDTAGRRLYYVLSKGKAYSYPIAVGKPGFSWSGTKRITGKKNWPDWRPPAEMRQRKPGLPKLMTGGVHNPLGAKALYLGSSLYRIHGTNNLKSIGTASSSGCFRMSNSHVAHLSKIASVGTTVHVKRSLSQKAKGYGKKKRRRYSKRYRTAKRY